MKQLTCEVCGSNELMKQDGIFVCQVCGCKYSLEDVKKMMVEGVVEVTGTVKVDNSAAISNYLNMAKNALDAGNEKEADDYCNKIIEIDMTNWEAWFIKGRAVGWQSTLGNIRIPETINAFSKALENCPKEKKDELVSQCQDQLERLHAALLSIRVKGFKTSPNQNDLDGLKSDVLSIINSTVSFLTKAGAMMSGIGNVQYGRIINQGMVAAWDETLKKYQQNNDGHPLKFAWETFHKEGDILIAGFNLGLVVLGTKYDSKEGNDLIVQIYENMITLQNILKDSCSYGVNYNGGYKSYYKDWSFTKEAKEYRSKQIKEWRDKITEVKTTGAKNAAEAARKKREDYWNEHKDLKEALEKEKNTLSIEKKELDEKKKILDKEREEVPTAKVVGDLKNQISKLQQEKNNLGIFKSKEKKALQTQIDAIEGQLAKHRQVMEAEQAQVDKKIAPISARLSEIRKRQDAIDHEFNKDR